MHYVNFHIRLNYHINYVKNVYLEIGNKIVKTTKFNILIIYYNNTYLKSPYVTKEIVKISNFIDESLKILITKLIT